ncbi:MULTISPECIES: ABC transporter permease [unclassified Streptomyces]|uniref:ABC transporter permease n=1 Tax=unclassified Streptomyces TaxID=2593676 RepID=UPI002254440C|nr:MULTISPECIES: ABC transporter permease [unclassified Streptomyces]MCX5338309.1 ABC transporter permease [Streptomyces sp. NBC_00140]MCX5367360.1 ABC transporter permease [Streptomyces sp. NBC_00124]
MRFHLTRFAVATRFTLIEHGRNRFAMILVILFVPLWTCLAFVVMPDTPARMRLRATGEALAPHGNELTSISGALNAVTLITGFMMFAATFSGSGFDRRLAMAGYPRAHLVLAKVTALALVSVVVAVYATAITCLIWTPRQPLLLAAALFCAGLTYGALGVGFGSLLRREVEGMFAIVMTSIIDLGLQNPITSSGTDNPVMRYLPSYGAMQASTAAGFSTSPVPDYLAIQFTWFAAAALVALVGFRGSTRNCLPPAALISPPGPKGSKAGLPAPRQAATPSAAAPDTEAR